MSVARITTLKFKSKEGADQIEETYKSNAPSEFSEAEQLLEKQAFDGWEGGKCRFCHAVRKDDRDRMAPSLYKILGRPAAVSGNFTYSDALINMRENGLVWTPETIDAFISDPENYVLGNRMRVEGIKDAKTRELIINYLIRESK